MNTLLQDLRYALRGLRRTPGASLVALATLALALGLNTSVFSLVNAINLRPLPYVDAEQLLDLYSSRRDGGLAGGVSGPDAADWRARSRTFTDIALYQERMFNVALTGSAEQIHGSRGTGNLFALLGTPAGLGRTLLPRDQGDGVLVVVLSHVLWRDRFAADPQVLGRTMRIDGQLYEVVGVMPQHFGYPHFAQFWIPIPQTALLDRADRKFQAIGRRNASVTDREAGVELGQINEQLAAEYASSNAGWTVFAASVVENRAEPFFLALVIAALFVLLVACANIGNLLLARGAARRGELAIRMMMGASRGRVLRQLITESATLALIGAGFGMLLSLWGTDLLVAALPVDAMPLWLDFSMDVRVFGYTAGILILAVLVFGVAPALSTLSGDLHAIAKERGRRVAGGRSATRTRNALVIGQIALTLVLLSSASVVLRSVIVTSRATPGYDPGPLLQVDVSLPADRYSSPGSREGYMREALTALAGLPEAEHVAVSAALPGDRTAVSTARSYGPITASGSGGTLAGASYRAITSNFFQTLNLPIVRGREFNDSDRAGSPAVIILSEKAASTLWPGQDPIGKSVKLAKADDSAEWFTVVGVASNRYSIARGQGGPPRRPTDEVYVPAAQGIGGQAFFIVRARNGNPMHMADGVRRAITRVDPDQPITDIQAISDIVYDNVRVLRWLGRLAAGFAAIALALASIGLFGVIAYTVTQRTQEIGIRLALGATPDAVVQMLTGVGTRLVAVGIAVGLLGAIAAGKLLASMVYGVSPRDPLALTVVALLLAGIALLACWWPARRASRVDPIVALQAE